MESWAGVYIANDDMLRRVVRRTFAVSVEATRGVWTCDEETRAAILENALRGRQPSDLMLRCAILFLILIFNSNFYF